MSRAAAGQPTAPSRHIYTTSARRADGSTEVVLSSTSLSDQSVRVNHAWSERRETEDNINCNNGFVLYALMKLYTRGKESILASKEPYIKTLPHDIWVNIFEFVLPTFGIQKTDYLFRNIAHYATAIISPMLFQECITMDPLIIVDAAMRGQEDMVMNILRADPLYLLKKAKQQ